MAAFFIGKTGAIAQYVMIYEYRYFVYLDNSQKYLDFLAEKALYPCRFRLVGKGLERETLCPFPRLRRFGTHIETGSKFLLLFSIKSKEERPCFAELYFGAPAPNRCEAPLFQSQGIKKRYKIFSCISLFDCGDRQYPICATFIYIPMVPPIQNNNKPPLERGVHLGIVRKNSF